MLIGFLRNKQVLVRVDIRIEQCSHLPKKLEELKKLEKSLCNWLFNLIY